MQSSASRSYLETEVTTATPQKLHLMLIEGAMRFLERTKAHWQAGENDRAAESLARAQEIVTEMLAALNHQADPGLAKQVASIYVFVFRQMTAAGLSRDPKPLDDALRVLQVERETWQEVCRSQPDAAASTSAEVAEFTAGPAGGGPIAFTFDGPGLSSGFSLEV